MSHIRAGVALLEQQPITQTHQEMELQLLLVLGQAYRVAHGFASQEYEEVLLRSQAVAEAVADPDVLAELLVMRTEMNIARGRNQEARALVNQALAALDPKANPQIALRVYRQDARVAAHLGDFAHARRSMERSLFGHTPVPDDDERARSPSISMYGFANLSVLQWLTGDPDLARENVQHGLDLARVHATPFDFTNMLFLSSILYRNIGDLASVEANADQMVSLGAKYDLPLSRQSGDIFTGWVLAHRGDVRGGIQQTTRGIDGFRHMGHTMYQTHRLAMLVEMHLMANQTDDAQRVLDEALSISQEKGERFWDVELYRLQGDLTLAGGADSRAEDSYQQAVEVARRQGAKSLELRATMALCRLWQGRGKTTQAHQRLAELYGWFTEGLDTHDLRAAKELLDQLR
jgi:tetratricopeptide (TPR) repeat protein